MCVVCRTVYVYCMIQFIVTRYDLHGIALLTLFALITLRPVSCSYISYHLIYCPHVIKSDTKIPSAYYCMHACVVYRTVCRYAYSSLSYMM